MQWRNYVRRGEAAASGRPAAGGATKFNNICLKSFVKFRLTEYPRRTQRFFKNFLTALPVMTPPLEVDSVKP